MWWLAVLSCGHVSKWRHEHSAPKPGEVLVCNYCTEEARVTALLGPWRVRCVDCRRVNGHATFRKTVHDTAIRHAQEWTSHHVWVWRYGDVDSRTLITADGKGQQVGTQPPLFTDAPF